MKLAKWNAFVCTDSNNGGSVCARHSKKFVNCSPFISQSLIRNFHCAYITCIIILLALLPHKIQAKDLSQPHTGKPNSNSNISLGHHVQIHTEKYSFELPAKFDPHKELDETVASLTQLRMQQEKATPKNVTGQIGHPVYLHCLVEPLGDRTVSWLRLRDFLDLLTVGMFTFSPDDRFVIRHGTLQANDWALQIKHVTADDEGLYECQVNTDPPRSQYYYLHVVVPIADMVGSPDMFVRSGATINLTCVISRSPEPPAFVFWYHNDRMINYDYKSLDRGDITLSKNPAKVDSVISRLLIKAARHNDSGNYTCSPSNAEATSIYVHVLQGEKRQSNRNGIQNDGTSSTENTSSGSAAASNKTPTSTLATLFLFLGLFVMSTILLPNGQVDWLRERGGGTREERYKTITY